jgi:hypothetical protein
MLHIGRNGQQQAHCPDSAMAATGTGKKQCPTAASKDDGKTLLLQNLAPIDEYVSEAWAARTLGKSSEFMQSHNANAFPASAWKQWLWKEDPLAEADPAIQLNRMHLLGLLVARSVFCTRFFHTVVHVKIQRIAQVQSSHAGQVPHIVKQPAGHAPGQVWWWQR